jgi:twitching motility protein PilT
MAYLDRLLSVIVKHGGSDLHIAEGEPPKMRMHGDIMPIRAEPVKREEAVRMLSEVSGPHNWEIFEQTRRPRFRLRDGRGVSLSQ